MLGLTVQTLPHRRAIASCLFTGQGLFTHHWSDHAQSVPLDSGREWSEVHTRSPPCLAVNRCQGKKTRFAPRREVFVSFSLAPNSLLFHIIL